MKIIDKIIKVCLVVFLISSCQKDYIEPVQFSDFSFMYGGDRFNDSVSATIQINDFLSYTDVSQGALSHVWQIEDGMAFLDGSQKFTRNDVTQKRLGEFKLDGVGLETDDKTVHVLFEKPGYKKIRLLNKFANEVEYISQTDTLVSKLVGDEWVMDTTFFVKVYDTLNVEYEVRLFDTQDVLIDSMWVRGDDFVMKDSTTWARYDTLQAGQKLMYIDRSWQGEPTGSNWYFEGAKPEYASSDTVVVQYPKLGTFSSTLASVRSGEKLPGGYNKKQIPLFITVVPSSQPFNIISARQVGNDIIRLELDGEADRAVAQQQFFKVHVVNADAGFDADIAVQNVKINLKDKTIIDLEMSSPIYNSDLIDISFKGGEIISTDSRTLTDLDKMIVEVEADEIFVNPIFGFEGVNIANGEGWYRENANSSVELEVMQHPVEPSPNGGKCLRVNAHNEVAYIGSQELFTLEEGKTYKYTYYVWATSDYTKNAFDAAMLDNVDGWNWIQNWKGIGVRDAWEKHEMIVKCTSAKMTDTHLSIRVPNGGGSEGDIYFDGFSLVELQDRQ